MKILAYAVSSLIGFAVGHYLLYGAPAAFASVLVSYHLYLMFLVLSAQHHKALSLPVGQTFFTHLPFVVVLVGLPYMREQIPYFGLLSWLIPGLAPFETQWLFSGQGQSQDGFAVNNALAKASSEDHQEFVQYLRGPRRRFKKPGATVDDEFRAWLAHRPRRRAAATKRADASSSPSQQMN